MRRKPWPDNLCPMCGIEFVFHEQPNGIYNCDYAKKQKEVYENASS